MVEKEAGRHLEVHRRRKERVIDEGRLVDRMRSVEVSHILADLAVGSPTAEAGCTCFSEGPLWV